MPKSKVLITGGAGNIGGSLTRYLTSTGTFEVLVVDNLQSGSAEKLPPPSPHFSFIRANVNSYSDVSPIFTSYRPDFVFHYAATVGVARTLKHPIPSRPGTAIRSSPSKERQRRRAGKRSVAPRSARWILEPQTSRGTETCIVASFGALA